MGSTSVTTIAATNCEKPNASFFRTQFLSCSTDYFGLYLIKGHECRIHESCAKLTCVTTGGRRQLGLRLPDP